MAAGPDSHTVEDEVPAEHPGEGEPVGGIEGEEHDHDDLAVGHDAHGHDAHGHDAHGHDAHGHDDHGTGGDAWVLVPIAIGLVIGLIVAIWFGLGSGASPLG